MVDRAKTFEELKTEALENRRETGRKVKEFLQELTREATSDDALTWLSPTDVLTVDVSVATDGHVVLTSLVSVNSTENCLLTKYLALTEDGTLRHLAVIAHWHDKKINYLAEWGSEIEDEEYPEKAEYFVKILDFQLKGARESNISAVTT